MDNFAFLVWARMVLRAGKLRNNIHDQCSAEADVQQLVPATDREQRFALAKNFIQQYQLTQIPRAAVRRFLNRLAYLGRKIFRIKVGANVISARQQNAVHTAHAIRDHVPIRDAWHQERQAACIGDGMFVSQRKTR